MVPYRTSSSLHQPVAMVLLGALPRPCHQDKEDESLLSMYKSTLEIKRSDTLSLVVIMAVDRGFNESGFMKPVDRVR
jgi:hypothetical protein